MISALFMKMESVNIDNQLRWLDHTTNLEKHVKSEERTIPENSMKKHFHVKFY